jgi:hypothetical protein
MMREQLDACLSDNNSMPLPVRSQAHHMEYMGRALFKVHFPLHLLAPFQRSVS